MDLFGNASEPSNTPSGSKRQEASHGPLGTRMRPRSLEEFAGQQHILGEGRLLQRMIKSGNVGSVIFYGPPSSGKTTLAHVIARETDAAFVVLNAVLDGLKELREVIQKAGQQLKSNGRRTLLFVDEIHRWNKAQQDALLPHIESGLLTLIGATTLNPFYSLVGPLLSRCQLFELHAFTTGELESLIDRAVEDRERGLGHLSIELEPDARTWLARNASGDIRYALNALETAALTTPENDQGKKVITLDIARESIQKRIARYDRDGDEHYHYASAFIKSMRGSDPDAALYWMAAMLEGGEDPLFIFRRMLIFASEDVGLADPQALTAVNAAQEAFEKCGMPEGLYFLTQACLHLALTPKSNSTTAVFKLISHLRSEGIGHVPAHLKDKTANEMEARHFSIKNASDDYKYPHSFPNHWVPQQYLPEGVDGQQWYHPGDQGEERQLWQRLKSIKDAMQQDR